MNIHRVWLIGLMLLVAWAAGCASKQEGVFNPALLPQVSAAAEHRTPGRVALLVPPDVHDLVHESSSGPASGVRIHLGRIVEEAMFAAMSDALRDGVQRINQPPAADSGFAATLSIDAVRVEHDVRLLWLAPFPPPFFRDR
jgi:hypothetical protein